MKTLLPNVSSPCPLRRGTKTYGLRSSIPLWRGQGEELKLRILFLAFLFIGSLNLLQAQSNYSLEDIIMMGQTRAIAARNAETRKTTSYWEWKSYQANLKPQITLNGRLPGLSRISQEVRQPDGGIQFLPIFQSNIYSELTLSQPIAATGATVFVSSALQRVDDFSQETSLYNASPLQVGFVQPLFTFNPLKWDKKIEPLRYQESQQEFLASMENIAVNSLDLFFIQMIAQIDYEIAKINLRNTDTIFQITEEKYEMGKASLNDVLQLKLEKLKAAKSLALAEQDMETAGLQLGSYISTPNAQALQLSLPEELPILAISQENALAQARQNLPNAIAFKRRAMEAEMGIAEAKGATGFSANLVGSIGFNKSGKAFGEAYQSPSQQQILSLEFSLPIVDWGRAKSQVETAAANRQLVQYEIKQDSTNLEQVILTELTLLRRYADQVALNKEVDTLAQMRYQIAQDRFLINKLSITDLSIALQEKDKAKRDYVLSLWNYWRSYYRIRELTLYDFKLNQKITY
ncbi:MAG: TolC family protein [Bacteroidia bacterium]